MVVAVISLLPAYFSASSIAEELSGIRASIITPPTAKESKELDDILKITKNQLSLLQKVEDTSFVPVLNKIAMRKVPGVTMTGFSVSQSGVSRKVILSGVARSREDLVVLKKSIEGILVSGGVDLPVSNLAKDKDFLFTMTVNGTFN